jgi:hypothetical protein
MPELKRQTAYKVKIGDLIRGNPILEGEKLSFVELGDKRLVRVNVIGNNHYDFIYLTILNFEDGDSSQNLKVWVSSPWM